MNKLSQRQLDILDVWQNGENNILINAVAGSGKTSTLLEILKLCKYKTLFLAYNKTIQEEIQQRIIDGNLLQGKALTVHSIGLSALKSHYKKVVINNSKNFELIKKIQDNNKIIFKKMSWENKLKLTFSLMDMNDMSRLFLTDDIETLKLHFLNIDKVISVSPHIENLWKELVTLRNDSYTSDTIEIDFTDMIYLPVVKNLDIPIHPYYLMIDECQDLSLCHHKIVDKLISQSVKKFIACGDRNQSIYSFAGAVSSSFDIFKTKGDVVELPLDICYRCDKTIIDKANEVYNIMKYSSLQDGIVGTIDDLSEIKDNSMIICRNSSPLIDIYFELLKLKKSCYIKGEDILNSIIRFLKPYDKSLISVAIVEMVYKIEELSLINTDEGRIQSYYYKENFKNFKKLSDCMCKESETVRSLLEKLKSLFVDKNNSIVLCTIHKSKGLEADVVYILNENLIPSKFAKSKEQLIQETNLKYVARTRARKELYFLNI